MFAKFACREGRWNPHGLMGFALLFVLGTAGSWAYAMEQVVVIVLDDSGSMREKMRTNNGKEARMVVAKRALRKVVEQLPPETQLGVLLLNGSRAADGWLVPLGSLNKANCIDQIEKVRADGGTPLGQSMKTAMDQLLALRSKQPVGDYRLLIVTDGQATDEHVLRRFLPDMVSRGIVIDVIGVDMKQDHSIANTAHSYRKANDAESFEKALSEIFAESSLATSDTGVSDFDLIAGLPDGFAEEALAALGQIHNEPINSETRKATANGEASANAAAQPSGSPAPAGNAPRGNNTWFVVAIVVFILIFLNGILNSKRNR